MNPEVGGGTAEESLVEEIAASLASSGEYVRCVEAGPTQQMVDLHWCAHRAGRRVGMKVRIIVAEPTVLKRSDHRERVTMTVVPRTRPVARLELP